MGRAVERHKASKRNRILKRALRNLSAGDEITDAIKLDIAAAPTWTFAARPVDAVAADLNWSDPSVMPTVSLRAIDLKKMGY